MFSKLNSTILSIAIFAVTISSTGISSEVKKFLGNTDDTYKVYMADTMDAAVIGGKDDFYFVIISLKDYRSTKGAVLIKGYLNDISVTLTYKDHQSTSVPFSDGVRDLILTDVKGGFGQPYILDFKVRNAR